MIPSNFIQIEITYSCERCDKSNKLEPKKKHFKSLTHEQKGKCIRINHTVKNTNFFNIDNIFIDYITNHNKKFELYLVRADFILNFDNDLNADIKTNFHHKVSPINVKLFFLYWLDSFILRGYIFSHISDVIIRTISDRRNMS